MIACKGMALVLAIMSALKPYHYNQPLTYLLIGSFTPGLNQVIMGFTKPLCILLGHYGWANMGCVHPSYKIDLHGHKRQ